MIRGILFDFNGVLVDDEAIHMELFQRVLGEEGIELTEKDYYEHYLGFDDRGAFSAAYAAAGLEMSPVLLTRLIARKSAYYQLRIRQGGFPFFAGAVRLVESAIAQGLALGVVSGALRGEVEEALRQLGLRNRFKIVVGAEDVQASKPDPEGYRKGLEGLNALPPLPTRLYHPHEVLAIEDSVAGLESAIGAGLATLAVAHTYPPEKLSLADRVVKATDGLDLGQIQRLFADS